MRSVRFVGAARTVAAIAAMTLLASGCGGSDVTGAETFAGAQPDQGQVQPGAVEAAPGTSGAPEAVPGAAGAVPAPGAQTGGAGSGAGSTGTGTQPGAGAAEGSKPGGPATKSGSGGQGGGAAATGLAAGVERLVATAPIFGGSGACKPATLSEVRIGNVSTLSGVLGELFAPSVAALDTFVASQNACGGLNGHPIKLLRKDDQGDASTALSIAQEMIQKEKILAFVSNIQPLTIQAMGPAIKKAGVPIIGGDIVSDAWYTNSFIFPQASNLQSFAGAYFSAMKTHFKKKVIGNMWCIEVPLTCGAIDVAMKEMAPKYGIDFRKSIQVSITSPSYVQQCLEMKNAGVEVLVLSFDAATSSRVARSCEQVGWFPDTFTHPISIGNEQQFLGKPWLGGTYIPHHIFPHMADQTPAQKYYQASIRKFNPGFNTGGAASTAWSSAALLVAAAANLPAQNPTTADLLNTLYEFKGQKFTQLGGLTAAPLSFFRDGIPRIPYCHYSAITNEQQTGYSSYTSKAVCADPKLLTPSDPQNKS